MLLKLSTQRYDFCQEKELNSVCLTGLRDFMNLFD